eukprot:Awhi_evm1s9322
MSTRPENVGIIALETYFPSQAINQTVLEGFDKVSAGKYTIGLGQEIMAYCDDLEDINSICMTAVARLMEKYNISYNDIGRLEVGTETIIDKSKSVKTCLMQLFAQSGNTNVEGVDTTNACYGGTQALLNSLAWVESSSYDGRYALAVCGDIAVYADGPARPTGGAGCVAMLIGPDAPLVVGQRVSHFKHAWDFYKPDLMSEYPVVDGKLSIQCYLDAVDTNYNRLLEKMKIEKANSSSSSSAQSPISTLGDYYCFHSPFTKLVKKSFARILFNDFLNNPSAPQFSEIKEQMENKTREETYFDRDVEKAFMSLSNKLFSDSVEPSLTLAKELGNTYTASLYCGLASLLSSVGSNLDGKRAVLFSYGSGLASSMFTITFSKPESQIYSHLSNLRQDLDSRTFVDGETFDKCMKLREETHHLAPYKPTSPVEQLATGTFYLTEIDDKHRRSYLRK